MRSQTAPSAIIPGERSKIDHQTFYQHAASAYQPGCFFADRRSAMLGSIRIDDAGCFSDWLRAGRCLRQAPRYARQLACHPGASCISASCANHKLTKKQSRLLASQFLNRSYSPNSLTHAIFDYKILHFENIIFAGHKPHLFYFVRG